MAHYSDVTSGLLGAEGGDFDDNNLDSAIQNTLASNAALDLDDESEDDEVYIAAQQAAGNRKATATPGKSTKKMGAFQSMGLNPKLLQAITRKGFSIPTPIQRKTIPLMLDGQDVVGMARTGSGKTAAFIIPMVEKLKMHSAKVGARAVIMSPSRELALQTLKVTIELSKGTDLRTILLVGGDSIEDQFASIASNPDIIIATPGRFEHLKVEMRLDLSSIKYVVFDEADRLFEMGFALQLQDIIMSLPPQRQTHLFSATLPKSLVEFARAGLQDPKLVRLDTDSKVSPDLQSAFFAVKSQEKEGALLQVLRDLIKMPVGPTEAAHKSKDASSIGKKRKRDEDGSGAPTPHSTIVFAATKHHVEYLANLLMAVGYAVSYVYGSLDQTARKAQIQDFRSGMSNILVVTDVAARGVDIPILANVINYDFPPQPKIFVHRVGRTARAGRKGWSYNLVTASDMPYLLDLQLFLDRRLVLGNKLGAEVNYAEMLVLGSLVRTGLEQGCEEVAKIVEDDIDIQNMRDVAGKGEKQYLRTRNSASTESAKRAKTVNEQHETREIHPLFGNDKSRSMSRAREDMLARVSGFRPPETVFELGRKGKPSEVSEIVAKRRKKLDLQKDRKREVDPAPIVEDSDSEHMSDDGLEVTVTQPTDTDGKETTGWQDSEHFMSYLPQNINLAEDRGYGVHSGSYNDTRGNFLEAARGATMDLSTDQDRGMNEASKARGLRWDKKGKKYVARANDEDGSKGQKMIRGENGLKIAASMRSGRYDAWRKANKVDHLPRVGEVERPSRFSNATAKAYKHKSDRAPKQADKYRDDYYSRKKKVEASKTRRLESGEEVGRSGKKSEIRGVEDIRKARKVMQNRRDKNARPSKKKF